MVWTPTRLTSIAWTAALGGLALVAGPGIGPDRVVAPASDSAGIGPPAGDWGRSPRSAGPSPRSVTPQLIGAAQARDSSRSGGTAPRGDPSQSGGTTRGGGAGTGPLAWADVAAKERLERHVRALAERFTPRD